MRKLNSWLVSILPLAGAALFCSSDALAIPVPDYSSCPSGSGSLACFHVLQNDPDPNGYAIFGNTMTTGTGVYGAGGTNGVKGFTTNNSGSGVYGENAGSGYGVAGRALGTAGVAVFGDSTSAAGTGVFGSATSNGVAIKGTNNNASGYAAFLTGRVYVQGSAIFTGNLATYGNLAKSSGSFEIDHPMDRANKILRHSFVESPDMKNIYDGVAALDESGAAWVNLPPYFEALNRDFRYQLTNIGAPGAVYVADEIRKNRFRIAGGRPGMKVSWQVTGTRIDAWAEDQRIVVEEEKSATERGTYLYARKGEALSPKVAAGAAVQ